MEHYQITTVADMNRLLRACSIILTNFNGPDEDDYVLNHIDRLKHMLGENIKNAQQYILMALHIIEDIIGQKKTLQDIDYQKAVNVLNTYFKLW